MVSRMHISNIGGHLNGAFMISHDIFLKLYLNNMRISILINITKDILILDSEWSDECINLTMMCVCVISLCLHVK